MLKTLMRACMALCLLGGPVSAQTYDAPVGKVMRGDDYRKQRDHELGGKFRNGGHRFGQNGYGNRGHGNNGGTRFGQNGYSNHGYSNNGGTRFGQNDYGNRGYGNNGGTRFGQNGYGNRGYGHGGRLLYDDYARGERFRHQEESFDQRGRFHQRYRFKNIERDSYENRRRVWEQSHKSSGGGERFYGLGADWHGNSNRSFNHERGRRMQGNYNTSHGLRLGFPGF